MQRTVPTSIDTPALLVDLPTLERNLQTMADYCRNVGVNLRPHIKTHKSPAIAAMQLKHGAIGLVCAKLGEAESMADAGLGPLLIANEIVGSLKLQRLLQLHSGADVTVCVSSLEHARLLAEAAAKAKTRLKVFIEAEVGMQRCGVDGEPVAVALARWIVQTPALQLTGIMGYEGHAIGTKDARAREQKAQQAHQRLAQLARAIRAQGIELPVVSAVGTGTFNLSVSPEELTEIQPGSYCLMDADYCGFVNVQPYFTPAASVLATVIDRPTTTRVVLDVGVKGISIDQGLPKPGWRDDLEPEEIHEEHYCVKLHRPAERPAIGERIELLPTHICTTVNLHDQFHVLADGALVDIWPISGRGRLQ